MQVSVDAGEGLERHMTVELPSEDLEKQVEKRLRDLSRNVRMDGFRPGKVPMSVVRKRFGAQVRQEAFGELVESTFFEAASQENLSPAGMPRIEPAEAKSEDSVAYKAVFEVIPQVEIGDLSGVTVKNPVAEVGDADVDAMIERLRAQRATFNAVDRPAENGDRVTINFKGMLDGEAFEGGSADDVPLILGSNSMIEGFESGLIGATAGDKRTLNLKFPDDYHASDLAGKDVSFEVEVSKVEEQILPELDADFVKAFGVDNGDVDTLRGEIRANMERELHQRLRTLKRNNAMEALAGAVQIDLPKVMIDKEIAQMKEQARREMASSGQSSSVDLPDSVFHEAAERRVRLGLAVSEIVRQHELSADEERVKSMIDELAASYEDPSEVIEYYMKNKEQRSQLEAAALEEQVAEKLMELMNVEEETHSFDELMK